MNRPEPGRRPRGRPGRSPPWLALLAGLWLGGLALAALAAPLLPLPDPAAMDLFALLSPPGPEHWLGTDALGRDLLARAIHGARISLLVGLLAPLLGLIIGGALGLLAGFLRGPVDFLIGVLVDSLLAFPALVLALTLTALWSQSGGPVEPAEAVTRLVLILGLLSVPAYARVSRAQTLALSRREFVAAARVLGFGPLPIMLRELLPNLLPTLLGFSWLVVAAVIVAEGALSFLGLGVPQPTPSWGAMLAEGRADLGEAPQVVLVPALFLFLTVLASNLLGDHLRRGGPR